MTLFLRLFGHIIVHQANDLCIINSAVENYSEKYYMGNICVKSLFIVYLKKVYCNVIYSLLYDYSPLMR